MEHPVTWLLGNEGDFDFFARGHFYFARVWLSIQAGITAIK